MSISTDFKHFLSSGIKLTLPPFHSRYLAGDELNSDDESDQESDDEDNDDDPDSFEDSLDDNSQKGSPVDELRLKLSNSAKVLKDNGQPNLVPKYGNSKQKPSGHQQVVSTSEEVFRCQFPGCSKICKSVGGLTLHVKKMHSPTHGCQ